MSTYRQVFYQIVFSTKNREMSISEEYEQELYKYIWGIINNHKCKLYRINSMPDHIHIFEVADLCDDVIRLCAAIGIVGDRQHGFDDRGVRVCAFCENNDRA